MSCAISTVLKQIAIEPHLSPHQLETLAQGLLADVTKARAFGVTPEVVTAAVQARSQVWPQVWPSVERFWLEQGYDPAPCAEAVWNVWLPLAQHLGQMQKSQGKPWIQGVLGLQGAGKTTLTALMSLILRVLGLTSLSLSLDDLYTTYAERQVLKQQDPRLVWRGPPGTHDIALGVEILDKLRASHPPAWIEIPRFDKTAYQGQGDRQGFGRVQPVDVVFFEGWFVGVRPIDPCHFDQAPPPLLTAADRQFARDMNRNLQAYLPLWDRLDGLIVLDLVDPKLSYQWRRQAEHRAIASGRAGMDDGQIGQFVEYFWKAIHPDLLIKPRLTDGQGVDWVIEIQADHTPGKVYHYWK